jgi:predicted GIY-YIG superfamily endonuclease
LSTYSHDRLARERENIRTGLERHVYVLEFTSGTVKVGQTGNPANRFKEHGHAAQAHGHSVIRSWTSVPCTEFKANEDALIAFCAERWTSAVGREAFEAADFDAIVEYAQGLPYTRVTESELDVRQDRYRAVAAQLRAGREHRVAMDRLGELTDRAKLVSSLANDSNRWAASDALFDLAKEAVSMEPAAWAVEDPTAAERYLATRGAAVGLARRNAAEFELNYRTLYLITHRTEAESFEDIARFCDNATADPTQLGLGEAS